MANEVETVSLAAFEAQASRDHMTLRYCIVGWCISVVLLAFMSMVAICCALSYEETTETETVETIETIERIAQADNLGNAVVGDGDISIGDSTQNNYADGQDDQDQLD